MSFRSYYFSKTLKERQELKNKILSTLEISSNVFYRWLSGRTEPPKCAKIVISLLLQIPIDQLFYQDKDNNSNQNNL